MAQLKEFTLRRGLTVLIEMSSVTAWTGRLPVVASLAANCSSSSSCEGPVSETAGRPVDSKRSTVSCLTRTSVTSWQSSTR